MKNQEVAHKFFYDVDGTFSRSSMTVHYRNDKYYSYSTCIAQLSEDINGNRICIISENNFSMTTAKHIGELRHASPFTIYYLPQKYYNKEFHPLEVFNDLKSNLEYYSNSKLTQKANRERLTANFIMLKESLNLVIFKDLFDNIQNTLNEYQELYDTINDPEKLKQMRELQKAKQLQEQKQLQEDLQNYINTYDMAQLAYLAYSNQSKLEQKVKTKLRKYLNPSQDLSFIWFSGDDVKTSQSITVDKKEAVTMLKLWQKDKLKHGMKISYYTVLEVMKNYVKIGCHKIPTENLTALLNQLKINVAA